MNRAAKENLKETVRYCAAGFLTTAINVAVYAICAHFFHLAVLPSTFAAWFLSVLANFFMNSFFVFACVESVKGDFFKRLVLFFLGRLGTGLLDAALMFLLAQLLLLNDVFVKTAVNIVVIAANYFFAKFFVFKSNKQNKNDNKKQEKI